MEKALNELLESIELLEVDEVAAALKNNNIDVNQIASRFGEFPLFAAVDQYEDDEGRVRKKMSIIKLLVENGADLEQESDGEHVVLLHALLVGSNRKIVKLLLDLGAEPNHVFEDDSSILTQLVKRLVKRRLSIDDYAAVVYNDYAKLLLFYGANIFDSTVFDKILEDGGFFELQTLMQPCSKPGTALAAITELKTLTPEQRAIQRALVLDKQAEFVSVASTSQDDKDRLNSLFAKAEKLKWTPLNHAKFLPRFHDQTKALVTSASKFSASPTRDFTQMPIEVLHHIVSFSNKPSDVNVSKLQ